MKYSYFLFFISLGFFCSSQVPQGDRILGWQVDMAENNNYDSAYNYALNACMETVSLAVGWASIEPTKGQFDQNFINNVLNIANIYYPAYGTQVELQIYTMNTVAKELPKDLINTPFDDPEMISRFKELLDKLFEHIPNIELSVLNIGNESEGVMGTDRSKYMEYKRFLNEVIPHAKKLYSDLHQYELKVGTTFTFHGLTDQSTKSLCQLVNNNLDVVSVTYYPLNNDFTMKDPSLVFLDFDKIVATYTNPDQAIYFVECGYSSSATCNSSDEKQAQFWYNVFSAWDQHIDHIKYLMVFKSTDWSQSTVDELGRYYGINDKRFLEYLRTLGVRTWAGNGTNKPAYETIKCALKSRGWCDVKCLNSSTRILNNDVKINVFPNPFVDDFSMQYSDRFNSDYTLKIFSNTGSIIKTIPQYKSNQAIKLNEFNTGFYFIQLINNAHDIHFAKVLKL